MDPIRQQLAERLEKSHAELLALVAELDHSRAGLPSANPGWSVQDVVAHLAAAERGHQAVIHALLTGGDLAQIGNGFDLDAFNEREVSARRGRKLDEVLAELAVNRDDTLRLLDSVQPEQWTLDGHHPAGFDTTVAGTFRIIAIHERRHVKDMRAALAAA